MDGRDEVNSLSCNLLGFIHQRMRQYGYTPLLHAAMNGFLHVVEYLFEKGADLNISADVRLFIRVIYITERI